MSSLTQCLEQVITTQNINQSGCDIFPLTEYEVRPEKYIFTKPEEQVI